MAHSIRALFVDVGGVLGTNGWDHRARARAADRFNLDLQELNDRHNMTFDTYEVGKTDLSTYLDRVVFYQNRPFTKDDFRTFMFSCSHPFQDTIDLVRTLKRQHQLKVLVVSNEGRELTLHRIRAFDLNSFVDAFISSCFVHFRKPDQDIYRLALDVSGLPAEDVVYLDDRAMFVEVASGLGIKAIHHTSCQNTQAALKQLGL